MATQILADAALAEKVASAKRDVGNIVKALGDALHQIGFDGTNKYDGKLFDVLTVIAGRATTIGVAGSALGLLELDILTHGDLAS